jgi:predicted ArsR family transcriptional regulator/quercetin dioxygenase-like cupin family protein
MTAAEVAHRLHVHPNTVRFHLQALMTEGSVERALPAAASSGRPPTRYRTVTGMDPGGPRGYRMLAAMFATGYDRRYAAETDPTARAVAVGRAWGRQLAAPAQGGPPPSHKDAADLLVRLFTALGFAAEPLPAGDPAPESLVLRHCPFLELVTGEGAVPGRLVCAVHLGLLRGTLDAVEAPVAADRLEPFAGPDRCIAHLVPRIPMSPRPPAGPSGAGTTSPDQGARMHSESLHSLGDELLAAAAANDAHGRSARTIYGGHEHSLRQTVIALRAGTSLAEHESPPEATLHVLAGRVRLTTADGNAWEGGPAALVVIPPERHDLTALEDSVVLLTVATRTGADS